MTMILEKIPLVMRDVGAIAKNGKHQQGYRFRSIDDLINALHPALVEHHVTPSVRCDGQHLEQVIEKKANGEPRVVFHAHCRVMVTLFAEDGSTLELSGIGEGMDYGGDKAFNKAMSAGLKYAYGHGLCIPFSDADDNDKQTTATREVSPGVDILAAANAAASTPSVVPTDVNATAPLDPLPLVHGDQTKPCVPEQRNRIIELAQKLNWPPEALSSICQKRGKTKLAELTIGEAFDVVGNLEKVCAENNVPL